MSQNKAQEYLQEIKNIQHPISEIHNVWHAIKNYQACKKEAGKKNYSVERVTEIIEMIELGNERIFKNNSLCV